MVKRNEKQTEEILEALVPFIQNGQLFTTLAEKVVENALVHGRGAGVKVSFGDKQINDTSPWTEHERKAIFSLKSAILHTVSLAQKTKSKKVTFDQEQELYQQWAYIFKDLKKGNRDQNFIADVFIIHCMLADLKITREPLSNKILDVALLWNAVQDILMSTYFSENLEEYYAVDY